jgi:dihydroxyacid dehydratase/phosphogluconate dehydratase
MAIDNIFTPQNERLRRYHPCCRPSGALPLTPQMLMESPSGLFGMTQNAGMGWDANKLTGKEVLIIGTQGGIRAGDGRPVALGYHTGHWEIGLQMQAAAKEITRNDGIPFAAYVSDPCDGRSQGTHGMFDSLPYRNDAAMVFRRLIRSLPTRRAVIGVATCDKGLPATMIALASMHDLPTILVPGGATLPPLAKMPGKYRLSARVTRIMNCRCRKHLNWAAAPALRREVGASFWEPPERRRWWRKRWGWLCRIRPWRHPGKMSGWRSPVSRREP